MRAVEILQHEHRHLVTFLGELAGHVGDHSPEDQHGAVVALGRLGNAAVDLAPQRRLDPQQRMVGDVQAEHLLLEAQPVALVELVVGDRDTLVEPFDAVATEVAEQAHHALITFATAYERAVDDLLEDHQQTRVGNGRANRTRRP